VAERKYEELAEQAIYNIKEDRDRTEKMLKDLQKSLSNGTFTYIEAGPTAAKFLETLQRSNEQLVKLVSILSRKQSNSSRTLKLDDEERDELFRTIEQQKD
jgi:hypothetical protein